MLLRVKFIKSFFVRHFLFRQDAILLDLRVITVRCKHIATTSLSTRHMWRIAFTMWRMAVLLKIWFLFDTLKRKSLVHPFSS